MDLNDLAPLASSVVKPTMWWLQRQQFLQAKPYERTAHRRAYVNGYKAKKWKSPIGNRLAKAVADGVTMSLPAEPRQ